MLLAIVVCGAGTWTVVSLFQETQVTSSMFNNHLSGATIGQVELTIMNDETLQNNSNNNNNNTIFDYQKDKEKTREIKETK